MPDPNRTQNVLEFPGFSGRKIASGGDLTSNGGVQLLRLADERTRLIKAIVQTKDDDRRTHSRTHDLESLIRQRVYALSLGDEDLNDHETLRSDLAL